LNFYVSDFVEILNRINFFLFL